ncbi:DUF308 domain-containing protein [Nocardia sp. NPDC050710]|uniref:DUF308 domain-containing protein n=1 Tax=Nocardia sp. NPDC050710 TaxID=3157220 RepID=UPI0033CBF854
MPGNDGAGGVEPRVRGARQAVLVAGACAVILGVVVVVWPEKTVAVAELLFGAYLIVSAALQLWLAITARFAMPLRMLVFGSGVLSVVLVMLCLRGGNSELLLAMWIGLGWSIRGIVHATVAVWDDELPDGGRHELFGLFTMVVGIVVVVVPFESLDVLSLVVGGCLVVIGTLEILIVGLGHDAVGVRGMEQVPVARG